MKRFTQYNTEGFSDAVLAKMNADFDRATADFSDEEKCDKSLTDYIAERIMDKYSYGASAPPFSAVRAVGGSNWRDMKWKLI